jgi:hypothetical protein
MGLGCLSPTQGTNTGCEVAQVAGSGETINLVVCISVAVD